MGNKAHSRKAQTLVEQIKQGWETFLSQKEITNMGVANKYHSEFVAVFEQKLIYSEMDEFQRIGKEKMPGIIDEKLNAIAKKILDETADLEAKELEKKNLREEGYTKALKLVKTSQISKKIAELREIFRQLKQLEESHGIDCINHYSGATLYRTLREDDAKLFIQNSNDWRPNI